MSVQTLITSRYPGYTPRSGTPGNAGQLSPGSAGPLTFPLFPVNGGGAQLPPAQPSDTADAIHTVADAYLAALGSQPANAGATVVVPTPPIDGGSGMNAKTILLVAALAVAAWFLYKKFGPSSSAAA